MGLPGWLRVLISIHALLAESDFFLFMVYSMFVYFYPRSPCGERHRCFNALPSRFGFLSTLSLRRATVRKVRRSYRNQDFYPRSPCGERPLLYAMGYYRHGNFYPRSPCGERPTYFDTSSIDDLISIHALLAESDAVMHNIIFMPGEFLSTLSLRRATARRASRQQPAGISIHALLAESDYTRPYSFPFKQIFLSTLSLRRATS